MEIPRCGSRSQSQAAERASAPAIGVTLTLQLRTRLGFGLAALGKCSEIKERFKIDVLPPRSLAIASVYRF